MKTTREIKLKSGIIIPQGTECKISWKNNHYTVAQVECENGVKFSTATSKLGNKFDIDIPDIEMLEEWSNDGVCETVFGNITEPDGTGPDGEPSWLLALGLI